MKKLLLIAVAFTFAATAQAQSPPAAATSTCKGQAADKNLHGAAEKSFLTKCEKDAKTSCEFTGRRQEAWRRRQDQLHAQMRERCGRNVKRRRFSFHVK